MKNQGMLLAVSTQNKVPDQARKQAEPQKRYPSENTAKDSTAKLIEEYGDFVYDLCVSTLWSITSGQLAFRSILRALRKSPQRNTYVDYRRAWVIQVAFNHLKSLHSRYGRHLSPAELAMLDAKSDPQNRMQQFDSYFHRLPLEDVFLLLLRDKYSMPYHEISAALGIPEGSLKIQKQQAIRTLEDWIWEKQ